MPPAITRNTLFYGDNLNILRDYIPDESVDLIYLDPPFNSNRSYNVLFKDESGKESQAQIAAFDDAWHWDRSAAMTYHSLIQDSPARVSGMIDALHGFIGENQMMAYLVMMTVRLVELRRVLKPTGSLYLHCDPTASHYLKLLLDNILGIQNFRNEIVWKRKTGRGDTGGTSKKFGVMTDLILFYGKSENSVFNTVHKANDPDYLDTFFKYVDSDGRRYASDNLSSPSPRPNLTYEYKGYKPPANGWAISREKMELWDKEGRLIFPKDINGRIRRKRYLDEHPGETVQNLWDDIGPISAQAAERLGYPTQKPLALLERIIQASSNPGDLVLDPFCGCGTAIAAAHKLDRRWIGIDVTHLAISLQKYRLKDAFGIEAGKDYAVIGEPASLDSARQLSLEDRHEFQIWACGLINAKPMGGDEKNFKKGKDQGIDGIKYFINDSKGSASTIMVQVKSGHVKSGDIRDLRGVMEREKAALSVYITLEMPTKDMEKEALTAGYHESPLWQQTYPRIQIITIQQLLAGQGPQLPPAAGGGFKKAERVKKQEGSQTKLDI